MIIAPLAVDVLTTATTVRWGYRFRRDVAANADRAAEGDASGRLELRCRRGYKARMAGWFANERIFWRQFRGQFHTTGAVLPSGRFLARSLARYVGQHAAGDRVWKSGRAPARSPPRSSAAGPERPSGPGRAQRRVRPPVERAVRPPKRRFAARGRCRVLHCPVEELVDEPYDLIISGLPLNNFSVADVQRLLGR